MEKLVFYDARVPKFQVLTWNLFETKTYFKGEVVQIPMQENHNQTKAMNCNEGAVSLRECLCTCMSLDVSLSKRWCQG
jgi:hypothetical protein